MHVGCSPLAYSQLGCASLTRYLIMAKDCSAIVNIFLLVLLSDVLVSLASLVLKDSYVTRVALISLFQM